jgi:hypothetical protein
MFWRRAFSVPFVDAGEALFNDVVQDRAIVPEFEAVQVASKQHDCRLRFWTMVEPVRRADGALWPTSADYAQKIADYLGCHLHTARMLDFRHFAAGYHIDSFWRFGSEHFAAGERKALPLSPELYSAQLDAYAATVEQRRRSQIKSGISRDWILAPSIWEKRGTLNPQHKGFSVTHGWYSNAATSSSQATPRMRLADASRKHYSRHVALTDSFVTLAHRDCDLSFGGEPWRTVRLADVLSDSEMSGLLSHTGSMPSRLPDVAYRGAPRLVFTGIDWAAGSEDAGQVARKRKDLWRGANK